MMTEEILGKEVSDDIFYSSMMASVISDGWIEKNAQLKDYWGVLKDIVGGGKTVASGLAKNIPSLLGWTALAGGAAGVLGTSAYDAIKDNVSKEDPEEKFNNEVEAMFNSRKRELEDAKWMSRVREMRDELKRGYKKMTTEEYEKKYNALIEALNERSK